MKNFVRDAYGYINNRGRSKYWGVTVDVHGGWILSYSPNDTDTTHTASSYNFKISELDLANIAAKIYENGSKRKFVESSLRVLSVDKKWVYIVRDTFIYREAYRNQAVTTSDSDVSLFDIAPKVTKPIKVKSTPKPVVLDLPQIIMSEREYIAKVLTMILDVNLSESTMRELISVLQSQLK